MLTSLRFTNILPSKSHIGHILKIRANILARANVRHNGHHRAFVMYAVLYFNNYFRDSASFFRTPLSQFDTTTSFASALLRLGNMIRFPSADTS